MSRHEVSYLELITKMEKLPIYTDIDTLDIYSEYLLNDKSKVINHSNLMNLYEYVDAVDVSMINNSDEKMARHEFIRLYLEARIIKGIIKRKLIIKYIFENVESHYIDIIKVEILESIEPDSLKTKDIEFVNSLIFARLNYIFMHRYKTGMTRMIEDVETNDFVGKESEAISFVQNLLSDLTRAQRRSKQENRFNLSDALSFKVLMQEAYEKFQSNSQYVSTGSKGLNLMLNGGWENGRVYNYIGSTGGFKSGLLLNSLKWAKLHNKGKVGKTKARKTILFVSQENNIWETIERIFNIFASTENIRNFTFSEMMDLLTNGGFCILEDDEDIEIEFRYHGNEDIGVADIRGMIEELENENKEVVMIIQDYIERLRPPNRRVDRRVQLFDISNELHDLGVDMDIPIITASQFNREGVNVVESMTDTRKANIVKQMGMNMISESFGMLKNIDVNIAIAIEYSVSEKKYYLGFKKLKFRGADEAKVTEFYQPFEGIDSRIMLTDDIIDPNAKVRFSMESDEQDAQNTSYDQKGSVKKRKSVLDVGKSNAKEVKKIDDMAFIFDDLDNMIENIKNHREVDDDGRIVLEWMVDPKILLQRIRA